MKVKSALATLPLVMNSCGGGDEQLYGFTPNEIGQGIWVGGFSSSPITVTSASGAVTETEQDQIEKEGVGLFTTSKKVFFYNVVDDVLFTNSGGNEPGFNGKNLIYSPLYFKGGNDVDTIKFDGNAYISTSLIGQVPSPLNSNYLMTFDDSYFRNASLNRLAGNSWAYSGPNGDWSLDIQADGAFTGTSTKVPSCTFSGAFSTIDTSKNEYTIALTLDANCSPYDGLYTGLAATVDTTTTNDTIIMAIYNTNNGFFLKPVKQP